jgi:chromosome partitioning protein
LAALAEYPQMVALDAPIRRRKAVANAMALGLSVQEMAPADPKAVAEIIALCAQVFDAQG